METSFGNWVRRRRKGLDLTQEELARRVGCSSSLIFKIETDERRPSRQVAELLAAQLQIPEEQRALFLKVARQELGAFRMDMPVQPSEVPAAPVVSASDFPGSNNHGPGSLPVFPTPLIGRAHEIDIVVQQIRDPACRLLTLTGPGGVGKTRLAIEVARNLAHAFPDGVAFLAMAGVEQPESIIPVVADAIGLVFSGPADPKLQLIQALRKKKMLLVFDNMEHLISGAGLLAELLEHAPDLRMLLTSREPVHLQWEWIFEVQGLPVPDSALPEVLETNSATALFLQRMRQVTQHIPFGGAPPADSGEPAEWDHEQLTAGTDAEAIVQICRLVDGLPLAIELAASWVRVMSLVEIAAELSQGLDLLQTNLQDIPARHRSIQLVFDHSWKLLNDAEREAVMRLAVFPGGFTRETAQKAADAPVMLLSALVSKSLLRYGKKAGRYDFHELVRQYVLNRLNEQPALEQSAYTRHAGYYADWLEDLEKVIKSEQQLLASTRVRAEKANWTAAWSWAAREHRLDLLRKMDTCLYWFFEIHGDNAQAVASTSFAVRELQAAGAPDTLACVEEKATYILLVDQLGWFAFRTGDVARASALFTESLSMAQNLPEPDHEVLYYIHVNIGYMSMVIGDLENAMRATQTSLEHAQALGGRWHAAISISILGIIEYQRGNLHEAFQQLSDSLRIWREVGDLRGLVFCMLYLSATALALEDYEMVETIVGESSAIAQQKQDHWAMAFGLDQLGIVALARNDARQAAEYFQQSLAISQEIGDQLAATQALIHLGESQQALGNADRAQELFRRAFAAARQARWTATMLDVLVASLHADKTSPAGDRLAMVSAVLANDVLTLPTRQRAERLCSQIEATLKPQQVQEAQARAREKTAEEWASAFFDGSAAKRRPDGGQRIDWSKIV